MSITSYIRIFKSKLVDHNRALKVACVTGLFLFSLFLVMQFFNEITTRNYGFYGTHYDFLAFYSAAQNALHGSVRHVYDMQIMTALQRSVIPHPVGASGYMPFLNPPFLAVLLSPLAVFGITIARIVWLTINVFLAGASVWLFTDTLKFKQRLLTVLLLCTTFPMYQSFIEGQVTVVVLFTCALSYYFLRNGQQLYAGMALLGLLIFPQFAAITLLALLYQRKKDLLIGWAAGVGILAVITLPFTGVHLYAEYGKFLFSLTQTHFIDLSTSAQLKWRGNIDGSSGLNGFYNALLGSHYSKVANVLYVVTAVVLIFGLYVVMKKIGQKHSAHQNSMVFITAVFVGLLIDPHLYSQGIIIVYIVLPALFVLCKNDKFWVIIGIAALSNVVFIDQYVRFHLFTIIIFCIAIIYARLIILKSQQLRKNDTLII